MNWPWKKARSPQAAARRPEQAHPLVVPFFGDEMPVVVTQSDAAELRKFLASPAGEAIKSHLSACIAQADAKAVDSGLPYECGVARGWRECSALLLSLSRPPSVPQPEQPDFVIAGDDDERAPDSP